jgi:hypothetical protein
MILLHQFSPEHQLVESTVENMCCWPLCNWEHNRPPDRVRCEDIAQSLAKPGVQLLQPFYFFYDSKQHLYHVLDGIHRYTALMTLHEDENVKRKTVLAHIFTDVSKGALVDVFENINKTIPVPNLYIHVGGHTADAISLVSTTVAEYQKRYREHFSPNATFCAPNINREAFTNLLSDLCQRHHITCPDLLEKLLQKTNATIRDHVEAGLHTRHLPNKFSDKQKNKCRKSGLYLFLYNCELLKVAF